MNVLLSVIMLQIQIGMTTEEPNIITGSIGMLALTSIGFTTKLGAFYRTV